MRFSELAYMKVRQHGLAAAVLDTHLLKRIVEFTSAITAHPIAPAANCEYPAQVRVMAAENKIEGA